jgi:Ca2+-binding RTX toxin-like protein
MAQFKLKKSALDFLLEQVNIGIDYSQLVNALDPGGLREVAGTNNNLIGSTAGLPGPFTAGPYAFGVADTSFLRLSQIYYNPDGPSGAYQYGIDHNGDSVVTTADNNVTDAGPRLVSLLVSTQDPTLNPAAAEAVRDFYGLGATDPLPNFDTIGSDALIPNAGVLGGGKYNGFLVAFGQFFDHGLDFIQKGGNGTVVIPLSPNDPNYVDPLGPDYVPGVSNLMRVSRATLANPDSDFSAGVLRPDVTPIYNNNTAMDIDQSQTYGSHPSVNAFLREYTDAGAVTGRILAGHTELGPQSGGLDTEYSKGLATWADLKLNAARIGVILTDQDVADAPALRVDVTGKLLFTPAGGAWSTSSVWDMSNPQAADDPFVRYALGSTDAQSNDISGQVVRTNQAFLIDINPAADPNFLGIARTADADTVVNDPAVPDLSPVGGFTYDDELLGAHFVAGDGRINENYMVTAVHNVFHEEHNYQVENIKSSIIAEAAELGPVDGVAYLNQWLAVPVGAIPADTFAVQWNGEMLFQAARLITESEYNHIAIDQFVGALYGALPEFVSYSSDINLGVSLEFAQAVFRVGHSMLNNSLSILDPNSDPNNPDEAVIGLMGGGGALNPTGFANTGAAAITLGLVRQTGEEIDEFVAPFVQNALNGQPLDLAAIDIARGRDVGLPTLNELRDQIYKGLLQYTNNSNGGALAPYQNWADFGDHLRHGGTLVNMIAAYARGGDGGFGDAIAQVRQNYLDGTATLDDIRTAAQTVLDAYADAGNPAHAAAVQFMVGSPTFHADTGQWTFEGANQGFWDVDLWIGGLAERPLFDGPLGTTFSYILLDFAQRMQDGDRFYYLYRTPMGTDLGDEIIANQFGDLVSRATGLDHLNGDVFIAADKYFFLDGSTSLAGQAPQLTSVDGDNDVNDYFNEANYFLDDGVTPASNGHIVIVGGDGNDFIVAGLGDDTLFGDAGNDFLQGSQGNDHIYGGDGDDFITDDENDDFIRGGDGIDRIFAGPGAIDTVFGDAGDDEIHGGDGIDELIGGDGNDLLYGDGDTDVIFGNAGDDYLVGGDSVDEMWSGDGNDWLKGGVGDDHLNGGEGNDLLEGGIGPAANDGDRLTGAGTTDGFPFGPGPVDTGFDVASYESVDIAIATDLQTSNANGTGALLDTYSGIDGLVGTRFNDTLTGAGPDTTTDNGVDNLLIGGAGNDTLTGLGGDDIIVGDAVVVQNDFTIDGTTPYTTISNWRGTGETRPDFGGTIGLGYFLGDNGTAGTSDKAVFRGNRADYDVQATTYAGYAAFIVTDLRDPAAATFDGSDIVIGVELFQFADVTLNQTQVLDQAPTDIQWNGAVPGDGSFPLAGEVIANLSATDPGGTSLTYSQDVGSDPGFAVSASGVVTRTVAMAANTTSTLVVRVTDNAGQSRVETFTIRTGNGNETLNYSAAPNDVVVYGRDGNDTINGGASNDTLYGQSGNDNLTGGAGSDVLHGGIGAGNDLLNGGLGADIMIGGAGNDNYVVDNAGDVVTELFAQGTDLIQTTLNSYSLGSSGANVEGLTFTGAGNFIGTGNSLNNAITGGTGNDTLSGEGGNDNLNGGVGSDLAVFSGTVGDHGFALSGGVNLSVSDTRAGAPDGTDVLIGFNNEGIKFGAQTLTLIYGDNAGNAALTGTGGDDLLLGLNGNDRLTGGSGNDVLVGGSGTDTAVFTGSVANYGFSVDAAGFVVVTDGVGADGTDTLIDVEAAQFAGEVFTFRVGSNAGETIAGSGGADLMLGLGGTDHLVSSNGADVMVGGSGADEFAFTSTATANNDIILDFTPGQDLINLSSIDANTTLGGSSPAAQQFSFIGTSAFSDSNPSSTLAQGQIRYELVDTDVVVGVDSILIQGNVNDNLAADFSILLKNYTGALTAGDFLA